MAWIKPILHFSCPPLYKDAVLTLVSKLMASIRMNCPVDTGLLRDSMYAVVTSQMGGTIENLIVADASGQVRAIKSEEAAAAAQTSSNILTGAIVGTAITGNLSVPAQIAQLKVEQNIAGVVDSFLHFSNDVSKMSPEWMAKHATISIGTEGELETTVVISALNPEDKFITDVLDSMPMEDVFESEKLVKAVDKALVNKSLGILASAINAVRISMINTAIQAFMKNATKYKGLMFGLLDDMYAAKQVSKGGGKKRVSISVSIVTQDYGEFLEYGNSGSTPHPFIRPTLFQFSGAIAVLGGTII